MGASLSSFAVRHKSAEAARNALRLRSTGKRGTFPKFSLSGAELPTDWYLICNWRHEFTDAELLKLSEGGEVVACFVEEHVMVSRAAGWKDGRELWSVTHDAQKDLRHLDVCGSPPAQFTGIRDELTARQTSGTGDYIFDIPVSLAAAITGFRYDDDPDLDFEVLEGPSFISRIFGR